MRMKGTNEEGTLYLSDLILSVFWGDIRCSDRQRRNQQEERNALQTHPEKNKDDNFLWWQIKKQGWQLLMMANKKNKDDIFLWWQNKWWRYLLIPQPGSEWRVFPCQSDFILAAVTPGDLVAAPSGQVVKLQGRGWTRGRETLTAVNFLARGHQGGKSCWWR